MQSEFYNNAAVTGTTAAAVGAVAARLQSQHVTVCGQMN